MMNQSYIDFANAMTDEASVMIKSRASRPLGTEAKADKTFVTELDLQIETRLRERINHAFPSHGIVGEEFGAERIDSEWVWTLDPIDGTMALVAGIPVYSTLISLSHGGVPVLGVMHFPGIDTRWVGAKGVGTTCNGVACHTRAGAQLNDAIQTASSPDFFTTDFEKRALQAVTAQTAWRVYGAAALSYGRLAMGRTDVAIDAGLKIYDYAPFVPIIEGAGGKITDWAGQPLSLKSGSQVLAAGDARRHEAALALIATQDTAA
jgi:inositol-phosphate phosphatase/L-galactose 1-phosphate phosphatase/histidinol-phosphatase